MQNTNKLDGIYAAAITPIDEVYQPDLDAFQKLIPYFAERGCHGALILGTTGEGPSFATKDRFRIMRAVAEIKKNYPGFRLFAGTGTPSLRETIRLNQAAFELGYDAVVVLPPYYFRGASQAGLFEWFSDVIRESVPEDKILLGYHIPQISGVALTIELLQKLNAKYPSRFGGLKDSEGKLRTTQRFTTTFPDKLIFVGNERLLTPGLQVGASGSITALSNLISPLLRKIFDQNGLEDNLDLQRIADSARNLLEKFAPFPAAIKFLMHEFANFPVWRVIPPLESLSEQQKGSLKSQFEEIYSDG